jgi:hypothetical protein
MPLNTIAQSPVLSSQLLIDPRSTQNATFHQRSPKTNNELPALIAMYCLPSTA